MKVTLLRKLRKEFYSTLYYENSECSRFYARLQGKQYFQRFQLLESMIGYYKEAFKVKNAAIREFQINVLTHYIKQKRENMKFIKIKIPIFKHKKQSTHNLTTEDIFDFVNKRKEKTYTDFERKCRNILSEYISDNETNGKLHTCVMQMNNLFSEMYWKLQRDMEDKFGKDRVDFTKY
ncbi:MAG: hypothetical protein SOZ07_06735 [Prevotella sp.]|nr:hypothetical protein [Prevotella sp.]